MPLRRPPMSARPRARPSASYPGPDPGKVLQIRPHALVPDSVPECARRAAQRDPLSSGEAVYAVMAAVPRVGYRRADEYPVRRSFGIPDRLALCGNADVPYLALEPAHAYAIRECHDPHPAPPCPPSRPYRPSKASAMRNSRRGASIGRSANPRSVCATSTVAPPAANAPALPVGVCPFGVIAAPSPRPVAPAFPFVVSSRSGVWRRRRQAPAIVGACSTSATDGLEIDKRRRVPHIGARDISFLRRPDLTSNGGIES